MKKFILILLAFSMVLFLTGCDGGGGGGGSDVSSTSYIISDINPKDDITSDIDNISGGISFTATALLIPEEVTIYDKLILKSDNTFSCTLKMLGDGAVVVPNTTFTGTWTGDDTTMTLTVKQAEEAGVTEPYNDTWTYVISDGGNTLTKNEAYPATNGWCPTYTKQ